MIETFMDDNFIYNEMMTHPVLFSLRQARTVALIANVTHGIADEILKHTTVTQLTCVPLTSNQPPTSTDARLQYNSDGLTAWLKNAKAATYDCIILADTPDQSLLSAPHYLKLLTADGLLMCQSTTFFQLPHLQATYQQLRHAGFHDQQTLHFFQPNLPSGSRAAIIAGRRGAIKRVREQDIYNKSFSTRFYNYDIHRAAMVMPEFMRETLAVEAD